LLSSKIVQFSLLSAFFAALAGLGLGLILDNFNRERPRRVVGWTLLGTGLPLFVAFTYLGLHT
jgi:F0F1-type ATP synthase assembly protein I